MPAFWLNLKLEKGSVFKKTFVWKLANGGVQDLTGWTARMQFRTKVSSPTVLLELTTENDGILLGGAAGSIYIEATAAQTDALPEVNNGRYDLELVSAGEPARLVEGYFSVSANVTR